MLMEGKNKGSRRRLAWLLHKGLLRGGGSSGPSYSGSEYFDGSTFTDGGPAAITSLTFPFSISVFCRLSGSATDAIRTTMSYVDDNGGTRFFCLRTDSGGHNIVPVRRAGGVASTGAAIGTLADDTWHHVAINFLSATSFDAWFDGSKTINATGATSIAIDANFDSYTGAALRNTDGANKWWGDLWKCQLFDASQTDSDIAALVAGNNSSQTPVTTLYA